MFETTQLSPVYNGYQYLFIFITAICLDLVVHFFSSRRYYGLKTNEFGFAPELMIYYRSLCRKGPFSIDGIGIESFYGSCNSWLLGAIIAGSVGVILLLITDLMLQAFEYKNKI